jgi:MYXO-CTERM domain-containing protein
MIGSITATLLAATTVAHPAAFSLTASPAAITAKPGTVTEFVIKDSGTKAVTVNTALAVIGKVSGDCNITNQQPSYARISPATIALAPGETHTVKVRVAHSAPKSALAVEFTSLRSGTGNVKVRAGVASQLVVVHAKVNHGHGKPCLAVHGTVHHATATSAGSGSVTYGGIAAVALALLGGIVWRIRRWRKFTWRKGDVQLQGKHRAQS